MTIQYFEENKIWLCYWQFLGGIVGFMLLIVVNSIFNGYVLSVLWGWFVVPTFNAPALGIVPAIGIALVVGYLIQQTNDTKNEPLGEQIAEATMTTILKPSFALLFGWVIHLFM